MSEYFAGDQIFPAWTNLEKCSKDLSKVASASLGKQHAGSSIDLKWYDMHSQQVPFLEQGS